MVAVVSAAENMSTVVRMLVRGSCSFCAMSAIDHPPRKYCTSVAKRASSRASSAPGQLRTECNSAGDSSARSCLTELSSSTECASITVA